MLDKNEINISDGTHIRFTMGSLWVIIVAFFALGVAFTGGVWKASAILSEMQRDVKELSTDKVSQKQASQWIYEAQMRNRTLDLPPLPEPRPQSKRNMTAVAVISENEYRRR